MVFKMNIVACIMMLATSQIGEAVYNYQWQMDVFSGEILCTKINRKGKTGIMGLSSATPRPPVALYGKLMARLLQLPKEDKRDISFYSSRPVSVRLVRRNMPITPCQSARKPFIISNGLIVYLVDQMVQECNRAI